MTAARVVNSMLIGYRWDLKGTFPESLLGNSQKSDKVLRVMWEMRDWLELPLSPFHVAPLLLRRMNDPPLVASLWY